MKTSIRPSDLSSKLPDFRCHGPMPWHCELCGKPYKGWEVRDEEWDLLPEEHRDKVICESDFLRLLREAGVDSSRIRITYRTWQRQLEAFAHEQDVPAHHARIHFEADETRPISETAWCAVRKVVGPNLYVVSLVSSSAIDPEMQYGDVFLADWDGETYQRCGRPMFLPIRRLRSAFRITRRRRLSLFHLAQWAQRRAAERLHHPESALYGGAAMLTPATTLNP